MSEASHTLLGDILDESGSIKTGPFGTTLKASEYSERGVPVISVGEVGYGSIKLRQDTPMVSEAVTERLPEYLLEPGDIVFGRKGAVDRSAWVQPAEGGWFLGSDGIRLRLPKSINSRYISYQLQSSASKEWLLQHASGSTMLSLNQKTIARIPLRIPDIAEQQAIAEVLGALDDKIVANTKLADTADAWIRSTFDKVNAESDEKKRLSEILTIRKDSVHPEMLDDECPYVGLEHIPRKSMWLGDIGTSSDVTSNKSRFFSNDILFGKLRPYFHKVATASKGGICSTDILVLTATTEHFSGFALACAASDEVIRAVTAASEGTRMPRTSWKDLADVEVGWPGAERVLAFSRDVSALRSTVNSAVEENRNLAATRDALLPHLMSGKLRVKDAEKVVASAV